MWTPSRTVSVGLAEPCICTAYYRMFGHYSAITIVHAPYIYILIIVHVLYMNLVLANSTSLPKHTHTLILLVMQCHKAADSRPKAASSRPEDVIKKSWFQAKGSHAQTEKAPAQKKRACCVHRSKRKPRKKRCICIRFCMHTHIQRRREHSMLTIFLYMH